MSPCHTATGSQRLGIRRCLRNASLGDWSMAAAALAKLVQKERDEAVAPEFADVFWTSSRKVSASMAQRAFEAAVNLRNRVFHPTSSLATACGMQTLIDLVGPTRVLAAWIGGLLMKLVGIPGGFYRLAGDQARLIDDITGTTP